MGAGGELRARIESLARDRAQQATSDAADLPRLAARVAQAADDPTGQRVEAPRPWTWGRVKDITWALLGVFGLVYVAAWALKWVTSVLLLFVLAALLAFIIQPVVGAIERRLGLSRTTSALVAYLVVVGGIGGLAAWGITNLVEQASAAVTNLPAIYSSLQDRLPYLESRAQDFGLTVDVPALQAQLRAALPAGGDLATRGLAVAAHAGDAALNFFLVLFLSFYLVLDGDRLMAGILEIAPTPWKPYVLFVQKTLLRVVGGYLRGQITMGAIIGVSVLIVSLALHIRYALLLGVLGFFFEMVPMVGPTLIGAAMVGAALLTSVKLALMALGFYVLLQMLESNILGPRITGHAVGLHPIASMLGLVAGAKLFGLWGALFAVPVLGFAFVVIAAVYRQVRGLDPAGLFETRTARWPAIHYPAHLPHLAERWRRHGAVPSAAVSPAPEVEEEQRAA